MSPVGCRLSGPVVFPALKNSPWRLWLLCRVGSNMLPRGGFSAHADTRAPRSFPPRTTDDAARRAASRRHPPRADSRRGTRLPSSRRLAEQLAISRNTVIRAYDTLIVEGYVESRPASGIFVSDNLPGAAVGLTGSVQEPAAGGSLSHMPMPPLPLRVQNLADQQRSRLAFDFFPGRPSAAAFPVKTWRRLLQAPFRTEVAPGSRTTAIRPDCRRCARRLPIILRPHAGSPPIRAASSSPTGRRRASASPRGCFSIAARRVRSRTRAIRERRSRSRRPAPRSRRRGR